jgi:hypothetical protein
MIHIRSYDPSGIESLASEFLCRHWRPSQIWVDIEYIIENDLGVDIDYACLDSEVVIGLIGVRQDGTFVIVVEEKLADQYPLQYRSTLAQEVGHLVLHGELLKSIRTTEDAMTLHQTLTDPQYALMEQDANLFALAVLMPLKPFTSACIEMFAEWSAQIRLKAGKMNFDFLLGKIVEELARRFRVSNRAAERRLDRLGYSEAIITAACKDGTSLQL